MTTAVTSVRWIRTLVEVGRTHSWSGFFVVFSTCRRNGVYKNLGHPMPSHKFKIGDVVNLKPSISRNVPGGTYQVIKRLPENAGEL